MHTNLFFSKKTKKNFQVSPVNLGRVGLPQTQVYFYLASSIHVSFIGLISQSTQSAFVELNFKG